MRKLYLGNGDKQFKFADTTTEIHLNALDDGMLAPSNSTVKDGKIITTFTAHLPENYAYFKPDLAFVTSTRRRIKIGGRQL